MADIEKALDISQGSRYPEREKSPSSDRSSHDLEKSGDIERADDIERPRNLDKTDIGPSDHQVTSIIVDWDGPDDPERPSNFPRWRKFLTTFTMAGLTMTVTFSSSVFSAATEATAERFNVSPEVMILGTSLYICGFGMGPTIFGPMSELYGRKIPLFTGFFVFAIFQIPVAVARNLETVFICRFFQGLFGSSPTAVVGGALADIWDARERGFAMPSFAGTLFAGPICGPIVSAYVIESYLGWRWTQWFTLIMAAFFGGIAMVCVSETYAPVLLSRRAKRLRHTTGDWRIHAKHEEREVNFKEIATVYLSRPLRMLVQEPILLMITIYLSFIYGVIYLFFTAYPISFVEERRWSTGVGSLPFISILIGVFAGCALLATTTRTRLAPDLEKGRPQETRLITMILAAVVLPIGMFWYAWTSFPSINPWPQIIAGVPMGFSIIVLTLQGINYVIDCYTIYSNSAIAAFTFTRCWFGAGFPLFATYMFRTLGVQWATSVLGFIALGMIPVPVLFYKFGAKIRGWSKFQLPT